MLPAQAKGLEALAKGLGGMSAHPAVGGMEFADIGSVEHPDKDVAALQPAMGDAALQPAMGDAALHPVVGDMAATAVELKAAPLLHVEDILAAELLHLLA